MQVFKYVLSNFDDLEKKYSFWDFFASIGEKILFDFGNDNCNMVLF